jgi:hypothetical protein
MKRLVVLMMFAVSLGGAAQSTITYPYNPDGNADGDIAVGDLQDFLVTYGSAFSPQEIQIGDQSLIDFLAEIEERNRVEHYQLDSGNNWLWIETYQWEIYPRGIIVEALEMYDDSGGLWNTPSIDLVGELPNGFFVTVLTKDDGFHYLGHYTDECYWFHGASSSYGSIGWTQTCDTLQFGRTNSHTTYYYFGGKWFAK